MHMWSTHLHLMWCSRRFYRLTCKQPEKSDGLVVEWTVFLSLTVTHIVEANVASCWRCTVYFDALSSSRSLHDSRLSASHRCQTCNYPSVIYMHRCLSRVAQGLYQHGTAISFAITIRKLPPATLAGQPSICCRVATASTGTDLKLISGFRWLPGTFACVLTTACGVCSCLHKLETFPQRNSHTGGNTGLLRIFRSPLGTC